LSGSTIFCGISDLSFASFSSIQASPTAILVLALGIGASAAIFAFVDTALIEPLPYPLPDQLAMFMHKLLFGVRAWDPMTLAGVTLLLGISSMAASFLPARRAASVNPTDALRAE
jgi:ABC-type lipoprotein release transport system permease subunit